MTKDPSSDDDDLKDYVWTSGNYTSAERLAPLNVYADGDAATVEVDDDGGDYSALDLNKERLDDRHFDAAQPDARIDRLERVALDLLRTAHWGVLAPDVADELAAEIATLLNRAWSGGLP
ncbi:hypothetical protein [Actinomycetospora sp. CA-053990]|uniref:hypothetical protein n=1 Tax=Actinomycetospora sp. CA-053990 TaxID=3239891 RepID=UPI003D906A19